MKKRTQLTLLASLLFNLFFALLLWKIVVQFGGFNYVWYRLTAADAGGSYRHRVELFEKLSQTARPDEIVFLGDSQVEQCEWRELFGDSLPIVNRGIVGDGTQGVFQRIEPILQAKPSKIVLWLGVNDLIFGNSVEASAGEYAQILDRILQNLSSKNVVVMSVMPVNRAVKNVPVENSTIEKLNLELKKLTAARQIRFFDLTKNMADSEGNLNPKFTSDGLHLNGSGYLKIKETIEPIINNR